MFNLNQAIAEWRRQMRVAGIEDSLTLEELDAHLREEVARQITSGINEAEAFQMAVAKIGSVDRLQKEFKKIEKKPGIMKAALLVIGWSLAAVLLAYALLVLNFDWNLFHFSPHWNRGTVIVLSIIAAALIAVWFLAKVSRDRMSRTIALVFSVLLATGSIWSFPAEKISLPNPAPIVTSQATSDQAVRAIAKIKIDAAIAAVFSRRSASPLWFRGGRTLLLCMPIMLWAFRMRRRSYDRNVLSA